MFLMLTPSLACAMPNCAKAGHGMEKPCHGRAGDDAPMLVIDCMGTDLASVTDGFPSAPDDGPAVFSLPDGIPGIADLRHAPLSSARAPPWREPWPFPPFLETQRLLI